MKIHLSRRARAFLAKWGGVVLAAVMVIPVALFGGTYLMANSRIDNTLNYVTQAVQFGGLNFIGPTENLPPDYVFRVIIAVHNDTPTAADVNITEAGVSIGRFNYDIIGSAGWKGRVAAHSYAIFEGDVTVLREEYRELENKLITMKITGNITVKAKSAFVAKEGTRGIKISPSVSLPPPTTITPPEATTPAATTTTQ